MVDGVINSFRVNSVTSSSNDTNSVTVDCPINLPIDSEELDRM